MLEPFEVRLLWLSLNPVTHCRDAIKENENLWANIVIFKQIGPGQDQVGRIFQIIRLYGSFLWKDGKFAYFVIKCS